MLLLLKVFFIFLYTHYSFFRVSASCLICMQYFHFFIIKPHLIFLGFWYSIIIMVMRCDWFLAWFGLFLFSFPHFMIIWVLWSCLSKFCVIHYADVTTCAPTSDARAAIMFVHIFFFYLGQSRTRYLRPQLGTWPSFETMRSSIGLLVHRCDGPRECRYTNLIVPQASSIWLALTLTIEAFYFWTLWWFSLAWPQFPMLTS